MGVFASVFGCVVHLHGPAVLDRIMKLLSFVLLLAGLLLLWCKPANAPTNYNAPLNLDLLEEVLEPICRGGSCDRLIRLTKAIVAGTSGAHESIQEIAMMKRSQHFEQQLHTWTSKQHFCQFMPKPFEFACWKATKWGPKELSHHAILPHDLFSAIYHESFELFEKLFTGGDDNMLEWWRQAEEVGGDWFQLHPVIQSQPDAAKRVPFGFHGDDAGAQGEECILCVTWGSVAVDLPTLDSRLVFSLLKLSEKVLLPDDPTMQMLYKVLAWSFKSLSTGKHPYEDHMGIPFSENHHPERWDKRGTSLADGYCGAFAEARGDWKWLKETFYLQQNYQTNHVCHLCRAHTTIARLRYTDFSRNAHHRNTMVDSRLWWGMYTSAYLVCPLLHVPGFNVYRIVYDIMHTMDLGILQHGAASTMWELTEPIGEGGIFVGGTRQERFDAAYLHYDAWVTRNHLPGKAKKFKATQWRKNGQHFPVIHQQVMKAAVLRSFVYYLAEASCLPSAIATDRGCTRAVMWREFAAGDVVMRGAGKFLDRDQRAALINHFENALLAYNALAVESASNNEKLYLIIPKHHALVHIAIDFGLNPRRTQCYLDEDMVGRCKRLYNSCNAASASLRVLQRYFIMVGLRWANEIRRLRLARFH